MTQMTTWKILKCAAALGALALAGAAPAAEELPEGMVRLSCIKSTGTQYIDTGRKLQTPSDTVLMRFRPMAPTSGAGGVLFGNRVSATSKCFIAHYNNYITDFYITIDNSSYQNNRWGATSSVVGTGFSNKMLDISASITGITVKVDGVASFARPQNQDVFETAGTCTVLKGVAVSGGTLPNDNGVTGELYSFSIVSNGVTLIDLVPAKSGETVGMFDLVSRQFFGNAGTGSFTPSTETVEVVSSSRYGIVDPAVGVTSVSNAESCVFTAATGTDGPGQKRSAPDFYTVERRAFGASSFSPPVTNYSATYVHTPGLADATRLTWFWREENLLQVGLPANGSLLVNGVKVQGGGASALPAGYKQLEYLESRGNSWIDTGVMLATPSDVVSMKFTFANDSANDHGGVVFGNRVTATDRCFIAHYNDYTPDGLVVTIDNSSYQDNRLVVGPRGLRDYQGETLEVTASIAEISAVCRKRGFQCSFTPKNQDTFETAGTCTLFKGVVPAVAGATLPNSNCAPGRLHRFAIRRNGVAVITLVPAKNPQGIAGLYDLEGGAFFRSEGTEDFLPGPEVSAMCDVWVDSASPATLEAKPADRFIQWTGDVADEDQEVNPLVKSIAGWETIAPVFTPWAPGSVYYLR